MKVAFVVVLLLVRDGLCRPLTLDVPTEESELVDITMKLENKINKYQYTLVFEATPGNIIRYVTYCGTKVFEPDGVDLAHRRKVYFEYTKDNVLVAIESKCREGIRMKYFDVRREKVTQINLYDFITLLNRPGSTFRVVL